MGTTSTDRPRFGADYTVRRTEVRRTRTRLRRVVVASASVDVTNTAATGAAAAKIFIPNDRKARRDAFTFWLI
jgi:hypothetical protein